MLRLSIRGRFRYMWLLPLHHSCSDFSLTSNMNLEVLVSYVPVFHQSISKSFQCQMLWVESMRQLPQTDRPYNSNRNRSLWSGKLSRDKITVNIGKYRYLMFSHSTFVWVLPLKCGCLVQKHPRMHIILQGKRNPYCKCFLSCIVVRTLIINSGMSC